MPSSIDFEGLSLDQNVSLRAVQILNLSEYIPQVYFDKVRNGLPPGLENNGA